MTDCIEVGNASLDRGIVSGPEGGSQGGSIVAEGSPERITEAADSYTGRCLQEYYD